MKSLIFTILLTVLNFSIQAQKQVALLDLEHASKSSLGKKSLVIPNTKTKDLVVYVENYPESHLYLLDNQFQTKIHLTTKMLPISFKKYIGYQILNEKKYCIFFTNTSAKKFGVLTIDFEKRITTNTTLDFKLKKESYLQSLSYTNNFYLLTVSKNSSDINFYTFDQKLATIKHTVDFSFLDEEINGFPKKAYHHLITKTFGPKGSLVKIDSKTPNAIETTSNPNKLYTLDQKFVFSFDSNPEATKIIKVHPSTFAVTTELHPKPFIEKPNNVFNSTNHNSYIYNNKLFQIATSNSQLSLTIKDLTTKKIDKEILLNKEDDITFKNTPILQEGPGIFGLHQEREMEKTSKLLRKISKGKIGIAAYKQKDQYKITLGSERIIQTGGGGMMMAGGGFSTVGGASMSAPNISYTSFNPTFFAYNNYSSTKSVRIDCLFDESFEHLKGAVPLNSFDKIYDFEERLSKESITIPTKTTDQNNSVTLDKMFPKSSNVFFHEGRIFYGFVNLRDHQYHLIDFSN